MIPPEAYSMGISIIAILVKKASEWIAAKSGKSVEDVRADIKRELDDTDADLAADRQAEHDRYNAP